MTARVSVAVSTYGRAHLLPRLVRALERQTLPADQFEVVIVDDASPDATPQTLEELSAATPLVMRVMRAARNGGPAIGRNMAWRAAVAPVVAFTDDDTEPQPSWLEEGLAAMGDEPRIVVGRTMPHPEQRENEGRPFSRTVRVKSTRWFETCNIFYRRADLEAVGGFDEGFDRPGGEDTDLGLRVRATGATPMFASEAVVYHDVGLRTYRQAVRDTWRWTGIALMVKRHPELRDELPYRFFWKKSHPLVLLALLGLTVGTRRRWALALVLPWVRFRSRWAPICEGPRRRWLLLPAAFTIDLMEVAVMARTSARHRTLLL